MENEIVIQDDDLNNSSFNDICELCYEEQYSLYCFECKLHICSKCNDSLHYNNNLKTTHQIKTTKPNKPKKFHSENQLLEIKEEQNEIQTGFGNDFDNNTIFPFDASLNEKEKKSEEKEKTKDKEEIGGGEKIEIEIEKEKEKNKENENESESESENESEKENEKEKKK